MKIHHMICNFKSVLLLFGKIIPHNFVKFLLLLSIQCFISSSAFS